MERNDSSLSLSQDFDEEALEEEKSIGWQVLTKEKNENKPP